MRTGLASGAFLLLLTLTPAAQAPQTRDPRTFRTDVEAVELDVRIVDESGKAVTGLTRDDFEVLEDGVRQQIRVFTPIDVPFVTRPRTAAEPPSDVQSNREPFDGRLYVFVLDDLHTPPLQAHRVKRAVRRFLEEHFAANDRAALVVTSGRTDASQELTGSRESLLAALDRFNGRKLRSSTLERLDQYYLSRELRDSESPGERRRIDDPLDHERGHQARIALDTLANAARWLGGVPARRKALVFFSEGIDYDIHDVIESRYASTIIDSAREAITAASRANVTIYSVDPRGLTSIGDDLMELGAPPEDPSLGLDTTGLQSEVQRAQDSLRTLADETGGFAIVNANDFRGGFERIVRENTTSYVLGYQPTNGRRDGKFRKVEVRVRKPGLRAITRRGYLAPRGETKAAQATEQTAPNLRPLLDSPLPVSGLPLDSTVAAFRGDGRKGSVLVTLEVGPGLTFSEKDATHRDRIDVSALALATDGKVYGGDQRAIELKLQPETVQTVTRTGLRTLSRLDLPAGRYQIRVAAREESTGRGGSVVHDVTVPDFTTGDVAMSDLVVASRGAGQMPTTKPDPVLKDRLTVPPTAMREFQTRDTVTVFAELYDNRQAGAEQVVVVTTMTAPDGRVAYRLEETIEPLAFEPVRRAYTHRVEVPLRDVAAGRYILRVEARRREAASAATAREIPLRVRASTNTTFD